jgi:hypothetical protein
MKRVPCVLPVLLAACGGGNPLDNPDSVGNPATSGDGRALSFVYFQACVQPVLTTPSPAPAAATPAPAGGCHDSRSGTGGALRLDGAATAVDLTLPADRRCAPAAMYRNFFSAQGVTVIGNATAQPAAGQAAAGRTCCTAAA